ncbi:MAG: hypothetical protein E7G57_03705 [Finegoldia magna]|nr:hypothetical protein [Finegoldia magna]
MLIVGIFGVPGLVVLFLYYFVI